MLKETITYPDYNGNTYTQDFYFNLSEAELAEMQLGVSGGLVSMYERISSAQDTPAIASEFKKLILMSYGEKSQDGKRFIKSKELSEAFSQTEAYSQLYIELLSDADKASKFFTGILPKKMQEQAQAQAASMLAEIK